MKRFALFGAMVALGCLGGERKQLPGQAGNDDVDLEGSVILTWSLKEPLKGKTKGFVTFKARVR